ncbi:MAG: UpxY family transcription antiterminator [Rikenellaceae bacterium]|nr:UpxY family transcription antiterminator [Rikenellaceae bacterium]
MNRAMVDNTNNEQVQDAPAGAQSTAEVAAVSNPMLAVEWYVMRVTYQRELVAQRLLGQLGVESFVPTQKVRRKVGGRYVWREEAKVHNYIFVCSSQAELQQIKTTKITYLRFMMAKGDDGTKWVPQFVPADQMEHFMAICRSEGVKYLDPEVDLRKGDRVKVIRGGLAGVEGTFVKISAKNEKRVVVKIEGVAAVATAAIPAADVEKIQGENN